MSYKYVAPEDIEGIRKVKWDDLWHVLYTQGGKKTWDRVSRTEAMQIMKRIERLRKKGLA